MSKYLECKVCDNSGEIPLILGRISWYSAWRQYTFSPTFPTAWNRECLDTIINFINKLMNERANNFSKELFEKEKS